MRSLCCAAQTSHQAPTSSCCSSTQSTSLKSESLALPTMIKKSAKSAAHPSYSFYQRVLPSPPAISFTSVEGRRLFRNALSEGNMEGYFALAQQFRTQDEPSFCGLSTLTMTLNALSIDPKRIWKGPWRWYTEQMLDCCRPLEQVKESGISMPELVCLARCHGCNVKVKHPTVQLIHERQPIELSDSSISGDSYHSETGVTLVDYFVKETKEYDPSPLRGTIEEFRRDIIEACRTPHSPVLIASYSRKALKQTGDGHYSTIGGYDSSSDSCLIMDVARFKYPAHWVSVDLLFEAMCWTSTEGGNRGWMMVSPAKCPGCISEDLSCKETTTLLSSKMKSSDECSAKVSDGNEEWFHCESVLFKLKDSVQIQSQASLTSDHHSASHSPSKPTRMMAVSQTYNPRPTQIDYDIASAFYSGLKGPIRSSCSGSSSSESGCECETSLKAVIRCVVAQLPGAVTNLFETKSMAKDVRTDGQQLDSELLKHRDLIMDQLRGLRVFKVVKDEIEWGGMMTEEDTGPDISDELWAEKLVMCLLIVPTPVWKDALSSDMFDSLSELMSIPESDSCLRQEVWIIQRQLKYLRDLRLHCKGECE